jgi:hypothetical protein
MFVINGAELCDDTLSQVKPLQNPRNILNTYVVSYQARYVPTHQHACTRELTVRPGAVRDDAKMASCTQARGVRGFGT